MSARFRARKTLKIGPVRLHFNERGFSGWGLRVWRWSWSARTGRHTLNTPGPGSITWGGKRRRGGAR